MTTGRPASLWRSIASRTPCLRASSIKCRSSTKMRLTSFFSSVFMDSLKLDDRPNSSIVDPERLRLQALCHQPGLRAGTVMETPGRGQRLVQTEEVPQASPIATTDG